MNPSPATYFIAPYSVVAALLLSDDMKHADLLLKKNGIMIVDDTNYGVINSYVDLYLSSGNYIEVNVIPTKAHPHRVLQKIK